VRTWSEGSSAAPAPLGPWAGFSKIREYQPAGEVVHSAHRLGNDAGALARSPEANADLRGEQPAGAVLLEALSPEPEAPIDTYFVMRKLEAGANAGGGDWEYLVVQPDGSMTAQGHLALCERCHAEAGPTFVFSPG
jgi:hypothetical protein